jgi:hypothetical protein
MRRRFQILFFSILMLVFGYVDFRLFGPLANRPAFWPIASILGAMEAVMVWLPLYFWASESTETKPYEIALERFAHLSMGILSLLFFFTLCRDLAWVALTIFGHSEWVSGPAASYILIGVTAILGVSGFAIALYGPVLRKVILPPAPGATGKPLRIVQVSDLHVGVWIGPRYVAKVVRQIEALGPIDFLIFTGDIGDGDPKRHHLDLQPLGDLPARFGKFAVSGNHEGYWNVEEWNARIRDLGFRILENEGVRIETPAGPVSIHGVSDSNADPAKAFATLEKSIFSIFLAHQPKHAAAAIDAGVRLQLSGHTHAGQFLPWSLFIGLAHRFSAGLYRVDATSIYVNTGTGFWGPPFRLGTRSETTLLEFTPFVG